MRLLNVLVIAILIFAASYVYKIKFESTLQAERVAKLNDQIRNERNAIAALRAEWGRLDAPGRIQALAQRHLKLQEAKATQFDALDNLPERSTPAPAVQPPDQASASLPANQRAVALPASRDVTGSIPARR